MSSSIAYVAHLPSLAQIDPGEDQGEVTWDLGTLCLSLSTSTLGSNMGHDEQEVELHREEHLDEHWELDGDGTHSAHEDSEVGREEGVLGETVVVVQAGQEAGMSWIQTGTHGNFLEGCPHHGAHPVQL